MTVRKTCKWTVVLVALIAAGGWYAVRYALDHKDRLVLDGIRQHVAQRVPDWGVTITDAQVDLRGRVLLTDIAVTPDPRHPPLVTIPKIYLTLDADLLFEQKQVLIRDVRIVDPQVLVTRDAAGQWNWKGLSRPAESDQTPEITIERGTFLVKLAAAAGVPQTEVASQNVDVRLVPAGRRRYLVEGETEIAGAGALAFGGEVDLNSGAWRLAGRAEQIDMSQSLLEKAAAFAPDVGQRVAELSGQPLSGRDQTVIPEATLPQHQTGDGPPVHTVSLEHQQVVGQLSLPNLGLSASVGVEFDLSNDGTKDVPDFRVIAKVMDGTVTEPLSPVPLSNLHGELLVENKRLLIRDFSASNGASRLSVAGKVEQADGHVLRDFEIAAERLLIDAELRHLLPPSAQRLFDKIRPSGLFTVKGRFRGDGVNAPQVRLDEFTALDCSIVSELFAYPVSGIQGTVKQQEDALILDLNGVASGRPVQITGTVKNPGPEAEGTVYVQVTELPIDEPFRSAFVDPKHRAIRKTIEDLNLTGQADIRVVFHRPAGRNQPTQMGLDADVRHATLSYVRFPYLVTDVTGHVRFNPWEEKVWRFTRLHGKHGPTDVTGTCSFDLTAPDGGLLDLTLHGKNIHFDQRGGGDLYRATTTAMPALNDVWVELNPTAGIAQAEGIHITWSPGTTPRVALPSIRVDGAELTLKQFPLTWHDVQGDVSWLDGKAVVKNLTARHGETTLTLNGSPTRPAVVFDTTAANDGANWRMAIENAAVRRLNPGSAFRAALPGEVASAVNKLNPRGPVDADFRFAMAAHPHPQGGPDRLTSFWELSTQLQNDRLSVGIDLENVTGTITAEIEWDAVRLTGNGRLDLQSARALDMTLTNVRGPFAIDDYVVSVGSPTMLIRPEPGMPQPQVPPDEQLLASLYGGTVVVNAAARLHPSDQEQSTYQALVELKDDCDLKQWANEWKLTSSGINGKLNGTLHLDGRGTSDLGLRGKNCHMTISDTRLGELPAVARMMAQVMAPQQRDNTAFRWVYMEFDIREGMFDFGPTRGRGPDDTRRIVLSGDSFKMIGQGYVPFSKQLDPSIHLDFYSKAPPTMLSGIPLIGQLTKSISDNWFHVVVDGLPSDPRVRTFTEVPVDNALRQFFSALEDGLTPPRR